MEDGAMRQAVASAILENMDEICAYTSKWFALDYPEFVATFKTDDQAVNRGRESYETIARAIAENDPSVYRYHTFSQDRMVTMTESTFSPVANFVVGTMYAGRGLAPFVARAFSDSYERADAAIAILEDMIERIVAFNLQLFSDRLCTKGFLSRDWSFDFKEPPETGRTESPARVTDGWEELSPRELDVLRLVAQGFTNGEIAAKLDIRQNTVKSHIGNLFDKLGVNNRTELTALALKRGIE